MIEFLQNASIYWLLCIVFFDWDMILRLRDLLASFYLYGRNLKNGRKQLKQLQREQSRKECVTMRYLFSHLGGPNCPVATLLYCVSLASRRKLPCHWRLPSVFPPGSGDAFGLYRCHIRRIAYNLCAVSLQRWVHHRRLQVCD